jgi:hypothetical protein
VNPAKRGSRVFDDQYIDIKFKKRRTVQRTA